MVGHDDLRHGWQGQRHRFWRERALHSTQLRAPEPQLPALDQRRACAVDEDVVHAELGQDTGLVEGRVDVSGSLTTHGWCHDVFVKDAPGKENALI